MFKIRFSINTISLIFSAFLISCSTNLESKKAQVPIIDCHVHLYDIKRKLHWPKPSNKILYKTHLAKDYEAVAKPSGVKAAVLVLAGQNLEDNQWNLDVTEHDPNFYQGVVGNLSKVIGTQKFKPLFEQLCENERYVGYRISGKTEFVFSDQFYKDLELTASKGKTVDVLVGGYSIKNVATIARRVPNLKIIVDHFAGVKLDGKPLPKEWIEDFKMLAKFKNIYCKFSALYGRFANQPAPTAYENYREVIELAYAHYGADRLVYGSDWPVTKQTDDYQSVVDLSRQFIDTKSKTVQEKIFYKNAIKFYGLKGL